MIVSLNEIETSCYRAALGVGLSHGLAQDAALIGARLVATQAHGLAVMLRALNYADANRVEPPVFARDGAVWRPRYGIVPSLVAGPIAADLKRADPSLVVEIGLTDELSIIAICMDQCPPVWPLSPLEVSNDLWRELQGLVARTYVPASAASRIKGAGAGLRDDD